MLKKPLFNQQKYLDAFIKTAQYVASLTTQQDVWSEMLKVMTHFFGSDLVAFGECRADGEIIGHHWALPEGVSCENIFTAEIKEIINEVLEGGFLATHQIYAPEEYSIAILPIKQENQTTAVMLVGNRMSEPLVKELLNVYLAVAGLIGATTARLVSEAELRRHRNHLEKLVRERTSELEGKMVELEEANIRLQEVDRLKSIFLASMSHELRTPLNSIIGFTGIILQGVSGEITDDQRKKLTMVKDNANHLLTLINDVIDVSKIESGQIEPFIEEFDFADLMQEVKELFKVAVDEKGLDLSLRMPEGLIIKSDERRVKQVVMNLVSNALKFTDKGKIEINVMEKDGMVEVSVADTGIGIRKEGMDKLFKQFSRIYIKDRPAVEGTGLGLYLSQKIATILGGEIKAESEFGKGSVFTFTLPLRYKEVTG